MPTDPHHIPGKQPMIAIRRSRLCAAVLTALLPAALPALAQDNTSTDTTKKVASLDRIEVT
jgi:hypothetical protein